MPLETAIGTVRALGRALWRRKKWILGPTLVIALAATVGVNLFTPQYKSEARILYDGRENIVLRPEAEKSNLDRAAAGQETLTSRVQLVLSRQLALAVIRDLKLNERPEFDPVLRGISPLKYVLVLAGVSRDPMRMSAEERVLEAYFERVTAYPVETSRVIAVEFWSSDPELAARVANAIADGCLVLQQSAKQERTRAGGQWLPGEIDGLRRNVAEAEAKVDEFRAKTNLLVGTNTTLLSNQQMDAFNSQLAAARSQKAEAEMRVRLLRDPLRRGDPIEASAIGNSELIRQLAGHQVMLRAQLAGQLSTLLEGHPRIKELKAQIADLDRHMRVEAERLVRTLETDAKIAEARVENLGADLDVIKGQAASTNGQDAQLRALEREATAQREFLELYLLKYREATTRESLGNAPADARVISRAVVSDTPYFPKKFPIVLVATLATIVLSAGFVTTGELLRNSPAAGPSLRSGRRPPGCTDAPGVGCGDRSDRRVGAQLARGGGGQPPHRRVQRHAPNRRHTRGDHRLACPGKGRQDRAGRSRHRGDQSADDVQRSRGAGNCRRGARDIVVR